MRRQPNGMVPRSRVIRVGLIEKEGCMDTSFIPTTEIVP